jgi:hypothetical protein
MPASEVATGQVGSMTSLLKPASILPTLNATKPRLIRVAFIDYLLK